MKKVDDVTKYIRKIFDLYHLNDYGFFCDTGDDYTIVDVIVNHFLSKSEAFNHTIKRESERTAVMVTALVECLRELEDEHGYTRSFCKMQWYQSVDL